MRDAETTLQYPRTRPAFILRCGTPIKMDVDICENDTAIATLCLRSCLLYALFSPAFNTARSIAVRYTDDPFSDKLCANILAQLIRFYYMMLRRSEHASVNIQCNQRPMNKHKILLLETALF